MVCKHTTFHILLPCSLASNRFTRRNRKTTLPSPIGVTASSQAAVRTALFLCLPPCCLPFSVSRWTPHRVRVSWFRPLIFSALYLDWRAVASVSRGSSTKALNAGFFCDSTNSAVCRCLVEEEDTDRDRLGEDRKTLLNYYRRERPGTWF